MNACTREAYLSLAAGLSEKAARADAYDAAVKIDKMSDTDALLESDRVVREAPSRAEIRTLLHLRP